MSREDLKKEVEKVSLTVIKAERGEPILHVYGQAGPVAVVTVLGKVIVDYYNAGGKEERLAVENMCTAICNEIYEHNTGKDAYVTFSACDDSEGGLICEE